MDMREFIDAWCSTQEDLNTARKNGKHEVQSCASCKPETFPLWTIPDTFLIRQPSLGYRWRHVFFRRLG